MESEHEIYRPTWELNPGSSDRPSRSVRTVSQPPRQVLPDVMETQQLYVKPVFNQSSRIFLEWPK